MISTTDTHDTINAILSYGFNYRGKGETLYDKAAGREDWSLEDFHYICVPPRPYIYYSQIWRWQHRLRIKASTQFHQRRC